MGPNFATCRKVCRTASEMLRDRGFTTEPPEQSQEDIVIYGSKNSKKVIFRLFFCIQDECRYCSKICSRMLRKYPSNCVCLFKADIYGQAGTSGQQRGIFRNQSPSAKHHKALFGSTAFEIVCEGSSAAFERRSMRAFAASQNFALGSCGSVLRLPGGFSYPNSKKIWAST